MISKLLKRGQSFETKCIVNAPNKSLNKLESEYTVIDEKIQEREDFTVQEFKEKRKSILDHMTKTFFLTEIFRGMWTVLENFFRRPYTINYPFEKGPLSPRFRGEHALRRYPNGEERCIACKL